MQFSANLGLLYREYSLLDAMRQAAQDGFAAVELHWPFETPAQQLRDLSDELSLPILALNTPKGQSQDDFGLAAIKGREEEFWQGFELAAHYADIIKAPAIHIMAGHHGDEACFLENLRKAAISKPHLTLLIEPINRLDRPAYFLHQAAQARAIIDKLNLPNIKLMLDCYHIAKSDGDVLSELDQSWQNIGHIQMASLPDRQEPNLGNFDYLPILQALSDRGYQRPIGAEYLPAGKTQNGLSWLAAWRNI